MITYVQQVPDPKAGRHYYVVVALPEGAPAPAWHDIIDITPKHKTRAAALKYQQEHHP